MKGKIKLFSLILSLNFIVNVSSSCANNSSSSTPTSSNSTLNSSTNTSNSSFSSNNSSSSISNVSSSSSSIKLKAKNLIYIIGDGMGINHIENTKLYLKKESFFFEEYYVGNVTTHSANHEVTDSSAAATALATGVKINNKEVGITPDGKEIPNIMEISKRNGRRTGIVTTDKLYGGTPAGFSAHHNDRSVIFEIMDDQINGDVDLLIGLHSTTYKKNKQQFEYNDFLYTETIEELKTLPMDKKIVANIKNIDSKYNPKLNDVVTLKELTEYSLDYLSSSDEAFTLMVEGAYIDKHSHDNNLELMMYSMMDLYDAVKSIFKFASERDDTVVIFTADHETGGLKKANSKDELNNTLYTSGGHTSTNVPLYLYNSHTTLTNIDNTDIYKIAESIVLNK